MIDKRTALLQAATALFAAEGLAIPTARIAREAGVANGTLFNYFPTKQDLIDSLYLSLKAEVASLFAPAGILPDFFALLQGIWTAYIGWAVANPAKYRTMNLLKAADVVTPAIAKKANADFEPLEKIARAAMRRNEIVDIDRDYFYQLMAAQIDTAIVFALGHDLKGKPLAKLIALGFELFRKSVTP